jgi:hypothetical protein
MYKKAVHMEEWKKIEEGEGRYSISNCGRVRNDKTKKILRQLTLVNGYLAVPLTENKKSRYYRVHRLVAKYFVSGYVKEKQVNHIDGVKTNNHYTNLEWVTASENIKHAYRIGLKNMNQVYQNLQKPIPVKQYSMDGKFIKEYPSMKQAEKETGIDNSAISKACKGKYKHTGGYKWQYATQHK